MVKKNVIFLEWHLRGKWGGDFLEEGQCLLYFLNTECN